MHITDNIAVANVTAKPLDTDRLLVAVFLTQCSCLLQAIGCSIFNTVLLFVAGYWLQYF